MIPELPAKFDEDSKAGDFTKAVDRLESNENRNTVESARRTHTGLANTYTTMPRTKTMPTLQLKIQNHKTMKNAHNEAHKMKMEIIQCMILKVGRF